MSDWTRGPVGDLEDTHQFLAKDLAKPPESPLEAISKYQIRSRVLESPIEVTGAGSIPVIPLSSATAVFQNDADAGLSNRVQVISGLNGTTGLAVGTGLNPEAGEITFAPALDLWRIRIDGQSVVLIASDAIDVNGEVSADKSTLKEQVADPPDPPNGQSVTWLSDGTGLGNQGDVMRKVTVGVLTKWWTVTAWAAGTPVP